MAISLELSELDGGPLSYEPTALFNHLERQLKSNPDGPAVIVTHLNADYFRELIHQSHEPQQADGVHPTCLTWTYRQMQQAALRIVAGLQQYGVKQGSVIVSLIFNGLEWAILYWACMLGKYTYSALDPGALSAPRAPELRNLFEVLHPDAVFVSDEEGAVSVDKALDSQQKQPNTKIMLEQTDQPRNSWTTLLNLASAPVSSAKASQIESEARSDDALRTNVIAFTSGTTTGIPKGCPRTVQGILHQIVGQEWGSLHGTPMRNLLQTQNFRVLAPIVTMRTWSRGGAIVMPGPRFYPDQFLEAIQKHGATLVLLAPATLHVLDDHSAFERTDKSSLKMVILTADMITEGLYSKAAHAFPNSEIVIGHGMTEGGGAFTWPYLGKTGPQDIPFYAGIAPLGKVNAGTRLRVADDENKPVKRGEVGELHFCSNGFLRQYLGGVKSEDFYHDEHGPWFKSGDTGIINDDNWVYILGRKKDIVMRAGIPITPAALESCLDTFLASQVRWLFHTIFLFISLTYMTQTSVLGIPHPTLAAEPFAVVQDLKDKTKDDVKKQIIDLFGPDYALGGVATLKDLGLDKFPLNATGKIMKRDLEAPIARYLKQ